jgi:hypothetical protein
MPRPVWTGWWHSFMAEATKSFVPDYFTRRS